MGIEWLDYNTVGRVAHYETEWVGYAQSHGGHSRSSRVAVGTVAQVLNHSGFEYNFSDLKWVGGIEITRWLIKYPGQRNYSQPKIATLYRSPKTARVCHKYLYAFQYSILANSHSNKHLLGHIRMVVEIIIITYYVIAIPLAIWSLR